MANDEIERLLNEVGQVLAGDTSYPLDGTFLYAECGPQVVSASIFKDLGDSLLYRWPMNDLADVLLELWEAEIPKKRWAAMQYQIEGGKFDASFTYPQEFDRSLTSIDRRERILQQRYGNKRIEYPSIHDLELKPQP